MISLLFDWQRCSLLLVVLLIAVGLFMFTYESTQFNAAGFILVLLASFISGLRWTLAQIVLQREETGASHTTVQDKIDNVA